MWLALIVIGIVLLVLGWFLPMPYPGKQLLVAGGSICIIVGFLLLILGYVNSASYHDRTPAAAVSTLVE